MGLNRVKMESRRRVNADLGVEKEKKRKDYGEVGGMIYGEEAKMNRTVVHGYVRFFFCFFFPKSA
jgi:hypothetical protein